MAKEYLERLSAIMQHAASHGVEAIDLECKHFFSGAAVYAGGRICITLTPAGFAIKLPEEAIARLLKAKSATSLRYFPEGPIKKDYVVLPKSVLKDQEVLHGWIRRALEHALTVAGPKKGKRGNNARR